MKSKYFGAYNSYIDDNKISLKNILYDPEFNKNLISIVGFSDQYFITVFQWINYKNRVIYTIKKKKQNMLCMW